MMTLLIFFYYIGLLGVLGASLYKYETLRHHVAPDLPAKEAPNDMHYPSVTLQIPIYNEADIIAAVLESIKGIQYPKNKLQIQLLDDSNDQTSKILSLYSQEMHTAGWNVHHLQRKKREGFKAGALKAGLTQATGEFVAIFDADFVIPPDFLMRTLVYFKDSRVGCVQSSWSFINEQTNYLTKLQALALRAHFDIEQWGRYRLNAFLTFNGSAGIWRKSTILHSGNWSHTSLTEDLDLSFRAQLAGWKIVFIPNYKVPNLLPTRFIDFKRQQHRWAKGSIQCLRHLFKRIVTSPITVKQKIASCLQLGRHMIYLFSLSTLLTMPWVVSSREPKHFGNSLDAFIFLISMGFIARYFSVSAGLSLKDFSVRFASLCIVGISLLPTIFMAIVSGLVSGTGEFVRTPKNNEIQRQSLRQFVKAYDIGDIVFCFYILGCISFFFTQGFWVSKPLIGVVAISATLPVFVLIKELILTMLNRKSGTT